MSGSDRLECPGTCYIQGNCWQSTRCHLPGSLSGVDEAYGLFGQLRAFRCGIRFQTFRNKPSSYKFSWHEFYSDADSHLRRAETLTTRRD
jgi:hypothetical protein